MSTKHTREVVGTEFPKLSHDEVARLIKEAEQMRAAYIAGLVRAAGRRLAHLARGTLAAVRGPRSSQGAS